MEFALSFLWKNRNKVYFAALNRSRDYKGTSILFQINKTKGVKGDHHIHSYMVLFLPAKMGLNLEQCQLKYSIFILH